jgi:hypothetical protein
VAATVVLAGNPVTCEEKPSWEQFVSVGSIVKNWGNFQAMVGGDLEQIPKFAEKADSIRQPTEIMEIHGDRVHPVGFCISQFAIDLVGIVIVPEINGDHESETQGT